MILCIVNSIILTIILGFIFYALFWLNCNPLLAFYFCFFGEKSLEKLRNKTVWIVGASTGIGEELAYQLADLNCRLILTSTTESKLQEVKQNCLNRSKSNLKSDDILVLAYDIAQFDKNNEAFKKIITKFGNIDILATNAARCLAARITEENLDQTKLLFDINYFAPVQITRLVLKHWLETKSEGQILGTSSIGSYWDFPFFSTYLASKRAFNTFYRDLSLQYHCDGIQVSLVMPGPTETQITQKSIEVNGRKVTLGKFAAMSSERTCEFILVALANRLSESWISLQPILSFAYIFNKSL